MRKIKEINEFTNECGYFYDAEEEKGISINNGYNCNHPKQSEIETDEESGEKIGKCYCWSCPLGYEADEEDFINPNIDNNGYTVEDYEDSTYIVVEQD